MSLMGLNTLLGLKVTAQPVTEPVTLQSVKDILRLTDTTDDALITGQIKSAREFAEKILGRSLASKTYAAFYDRFPCTQHPILLPEPPARSVSAVKYLDSVTLTWLTWDSAEYQAAVNQDPGVIVEVFPNIYPSTGHIRGIASVEVDFVTEVYAGRGQSFILDLVRQLTAYIYANPDASEANYPERAVKALRTYKIHGF